MDAQLRSLINALPLLPEREDAIVDQASDLVEIARKLGMTAIAHSLMSELDRHRKWYGPKPLHPEQLPGEVLLGNMKPDVVRYIGWKSKRPGQVAFDIDGKPVSGQVPVFVDAQELAAAGQLTDRHTVAR